VKTELTDEDALHQAVTEYLAIPHSAAQASVEFVIGFMNSFARHKSKATPGVIAWMTNWMGAVIRRLDEQDHQLETVTKHVRRILQATKAKNDSSLPPDSSVPPSAPGSQMGISVTTGLPTPVHESEVSGTQFQLQTFVYQQLAYCVLVMPLYPEPFLGALWANNNLCQLLGYSLQELQGFMTKMETSMSFVTPETRLSVYEVFIRSLALNEPNFSLHPVFLHRDGERNRFAAPAHRAQAARCRASGPAKSTSIGTESRFTSCPSFSRSSSDDERAGPPPQCPNVSASVL